METVQKLFDLSGRTAVVTGGTGHLGAPIARALAEAGASVIVTSRSLQHAEDVAAALPREQRQAHRGVAMDQLDHESVARCIDTIASLTPHIDVLVNNAHSPEGNDLTSISAEQFDRHTSQATAYFILARAVRDLAVAAQKPASIICLGSMYGMVASYPDVYRDLSPANSVAYQVLKGGIIQMTRHLAVYWAQDRIRVNCISPGAFPLKNSNPQVVDRVRERIPMGRTGKPEELAGALVFLASDASSYVTGHNLVVDGGWTAW